MTSLPHISASGNWLESVMRTGLLRESGSQAARDVEHVFRTARSADGVQNLQRAPDEGILDHPLDRRTCSNPSN